MHETVTHRPSLAARSFRWMVRLLSRVRFGIVMLALVLTYAAVGSGLAPVRGALELTEMQVFQHWVFLVLIALFSASLITVTVARIRWNVINLGVLTVHTGLLMLVAGAVWYFGAKVEGDVLLVSPRIELLAGGRGSIAEFLAEPGQAWEEFMPAFGGAVRLEVAEVRRNPGGGDAQAVVQASFGSAPPRSVTLAVDAAQATSLGNGLSLRWRSFPAQNKFYDQDMAALYYGKAGEGTPRFAELPGLPLHRERYLSDEGELHDSAGRPVPSKRVSPALELGAVHIPTGWVEPWRMPIAVDAPELPFDVEVTGYVPYVAGTESTVAGDGTVLNPLLEFRLAAGGQSLTQSLAALDPRRSLVELPLPFEFRWVETPEELEATLKPLAGPAELTIEVRDPPVRRTIAVSAGQTIAVEGTSYELTVTGLTPSWPLVSPGYEGARSPVAMVDVKSTAKSYQRTVIERFPQLTQDIDEQGQRHSEGPYDPNLILRYRTALEGRVLIVAGPATPPVLALFGADGTAQRWALEPGQKRALAATGIDFTLVSYAPRGRWVNQPVIQPLDRRRPNLGRNPSAIRLKLTGRGPYAGWRDSCWCMFSSYPHLDATNSPSGLASEPATVRLPDGSQYELVYSRAERDLGATLIPGRLKVQFFPGRRGAESWQSDFHVVSGSDAPPVPALVKTNLTYRVGEWALFQSGAAPDHWGWTILGVGNRHGILPMLLGCVLVTLGCLYAFYVKPVLRRRAAAAMPTPGRRRAVEQVVEAQPVGAGVE